MSLPLYLKYKDNGVTHSPMYGPYLTLRRRWLQMAISQPFQSFDRSIFGREVPRQPVSYLCFYHFLRLR
jgi:hypothetical protein